MSIPKWAVPLVKWPVLLVWILTFWLLMVAGHLLREAWWIMQNGYQDPAPCGLWWCPETWARKMQKQGREE